MIPKARGKGAMQMLSAAVTTSTIQIERNIYASWLYTITEY